MAVVQGSSSLVWPPKVFSRYCRISLRGHNWPWLRTTALGQSPYKTKLLVPLPTQIVPLTLWSTCTHWATQHEIHSWILFHSPCQSPWMGSRVLPLNHVWPIQLGGQKQTLVTPPPFSDMSVHVCHEQIIKLKAALQFDNWQGNKWS